MLTAFDGARPIGSHLPFVIRDGVIQAEGQRKHNQLKPDQDHIAIVRMLESRGEADGRAIAAQMRAARPHLD